MEAVGYDTYVRLLEETVSELKGEPAPADNTEVFVEFKLNAFLDAQYIQDEQARLDMYRTIAAISSEGDARDVYDELIDRYGDIPEPTANLIEIALVKKLAGKCGFNMIKQKEDMILLYFRDNTALPLSKLSSLVQEEKGGLMFSAGKTPYLSYRVKGLEPREMLGNIKILLQRIEKLQSQE